MALHVASGALISALLTSACFAASATGSIVGTVTDATGAALTGATVDLRNVETGVVRTAVADHAGNYSFVLLPPASYDLTARMTGFRDSGLSGIQLDVDQVRRTDLTLEVAPVTLQVSVSGQLPLVETETSAVGKVVPTNLVASLPLNERNYLTLTLLVPGAHTPVAGSQASTMGPGSFSVNGAREQANGYLLDGIDNNGLYINRTSVLPSIDAIDEFKVQASTYSAEYGRYGGAQVNLVLKSGTNAFTATPSNTFATASSMQRTTSTCPTAQPPRRPEAAAPFRAISAASTAAPSVARSSTSAASSSPPMKDLT